MQRVLISLLSLGLTMAGFVAHAAGDAKATNLIEQARAALGGEKALSAVKTLSAAGTYTREIADRQLSGELTLEIELPDKLLRTETMSPMGDITVVTAQGINGDTLLREQHAVNAPPGAVIRMGPAPEGEAAAAQAVRNGRADMARTVLALLLTSPASLPVDFTYAGEAEAADGRADVIDAKGAGSFAVQLFLDKTTHRPLMLAYKGVAPQMRIMTQRGGAPPSAGHDGGRADMGAATPPQVVDITMFLDDYRREQGIWLPHHVSRSIDGKPTEEWMLVSFKVNPGFRPDTFSVK